MRLAPRPSARPYAAVAAAYAVGCAALWPFPLLGLLHAESSAVVAGLGFFASGLGALTLFRQGARVGPVLGRMTALLAVPLVLLTVSLLWRPNCGYGQGLGLFVVLAGPSPALGVALAFALDRTVRRRKTWFWTIGLGVAVLPVLWDLGLHPQFYTYNHVWGGVLGPIYDEELAVRPGLFWFRGMTLGWVAALVLVGFRSEGNRRAGRMLFAVIAFLGVGYALGPWLGINTPGWLARERLGGHRATEHFDLYYDPTALSDAEVQVIADVQAFRYHQLREALEIDVDERIAVYLYPDADAKAALTGARQTSVTPVWLPTPQMHLLVSRFDDHFAHELVHVFSREFGLPVLRASPAVGLVEGLAVALEPPDGLPPPDARVAAAARARAAGTDAGISGPLADAVADRLGPLGFWTGRGAVSYTTAGSFVRYLYRTYGPKPLRAVYARGDFEAAYGVPLDSLAARWEREVLAAPRDVQAEALVARVFTRPSLFERRCPHYVEPWKRAYRAGLAALGRGENEAAEAFFAGALEEVPTQPAVLDAWGRVVLARGAVGDVVERLRAVTQDDTLAASSVLSRLGDAYALARQPALADSVYARASATMPDYARATKAALAVRRDLPVEGTRLLIGTEPAADRAAALEAVGSSAAEVFAAILWASAGDYARAVSLLDGIDPGTMPKAAGPQRWVWMARFAHLAGDRQAALAYARRATEAFEADGSLYAAERAADFADLLRWTVRTSDERGEP